MNAWKVILSTLVIFIAGVVTGALLVTNGIKVAQAFNTQQAALFKPSHPNKAANNLNNPNYPNAAAGASNPWQLRDRELVRRMDRDLDLRADQRQQIESIIAAGQERTKAIWKPIAPLMNKESQLVHAEIRDVLTPDQKKKFDEMMKGRPQLERRRGLTNSLSASGTNAVPVVTNAVSEATNGAPAHP